MPAEAGACTFAAHDLDVIGQQLEQVVAIEPINSNVRLRGDAPKRSTELPSCSFDQGGVADERRRQHHALPGLIDFSCQRDRARSVYMPPVYRT